MAFSVDTYTVDVSRAIFSTDFNWDVFVFVKIDASVAHSKQVSVQRHKRDMHLRFYCTAKQLSNCRKRRTKML